MGKIREQIVASIEGLEQFEELLETVADGDWCLDQTARMLERHSDCIKRIEWALQLELSERDKKGLERWSSEHPDAA